MKLKLIITLTLIAFLYSACSKLANPSPTPKPITYWPVTKGSSWIYTVATPIVSTIPSTKTSSDTIKASGDTSMIVGKVYYNIIQVGAVAPNNIFGYLRQDNHNYVLRQVAKTGAYAMEYPILNDTAAVNHSWTTNMNETGTFAGGPATMIAKIIEKGISKTINGKTFANVIHTQVQLNFGGQYAEMHDYFFAEGVGMIQDIETNMGTVLYTKSITAYTIK